MCLIALGENNHLSSVSDRCLTGAIILYHVHQTLCKSLGHDLWEVRSALTDRKIGHVIFCNHDGAAILLHSFIKKTQKSPRQDLELALKRMKEVTK